MELTTDPTLSPIVVNPDARDFDQWLDRQLRGMFDAVAEEPIPQSLIDLVKNRGERKERKS
ncbi:MAG: NepR family anti-sigma factor [Elsteraceae bacterium]